VLLAPQMLGRDLGEYAARLSVWSEEASGDSQDGISRRWRPIGWAKSPTALAAGATLEGSPGCRALSLGVEEGHSLRRRAPLRLTLGAIALGD